MKHIYSTIKNKVIISIEFAKKQIERPLARKIIKKTSLIASHIPIVSIPTKWTLDHISNVERKEEKYQMEKRFEDFSAKMILKEKENNEIKKTLDDALLKINKMLEASFLEERTSIKKSFDVYKKMLNMVTLKNNS